ncbi:MAG TPA: BTAD domain-containing putative transcriptional regulator [Ktedonobacteraceae bacterium]|nr:BTAD domain-containing putative transcriptional regulator [Ktedonobacteraceae bacterium]
MSFPYKMHSPYGGKEEHHPSLSRARYKASFFGQFHITRDGQLLGEPNWRRNKAKMLVKWFLLNPGDLFSVEQLSKMLWPDITKHAAASNLHVTLHYLRHILEPELIPGSVSTFIRRNRHNYYWFELNDVWWTDIYDIQYLSTSAKEAERSKETFRAITLYRQLISYYSQGFLPEDIYEDLFSSYRRQHDYAYTQSLDRLMQLYMQASQLDDALSCALHILSVDPYSENAIKTMVHIYLRQGNMTGALRQLDDFQRFLKRDLGIEPGEEICLLRQSILKAR